jgi:Family of unknown function (DUF6186)
MSTHLLTILGYGAVLVAGAGIEVASRRPESSLWPLGKVVRWALRTPSGRIGIFAFWAWAGLHFLG